MGCDNQVFKFQKFEVDPLVEKEHEARTMGLGAAFPGA